MLPEEVLAHEPRVLTQEQREFYFANGYLLVESVVDQGWLDRLRAATDEMVDRSRALSRSDRIFDLEPGHTADEPRLRRLTSPVDHHPDYWAFASDTGSSAPSCSAESTRYSARTISGVRNEAVFAS